MRTLHHPNIVGCKYILASKRNIYIVMPYIGGGTLFDLLRHQRISLIKARRFFI